MRLLKLEIKRVLKTKLTYILLLLTLFFTFLFAYLPITFEHINYTNESGVKVELRGLPYIRHIKEVQKDTAGMVTADKLRNAVLACQTCLKEYDAKNIYALPEDVYVEQILPHAPYLHSLREAYADADTGMAANLLDIEPDNVNNFYDACLDRIDSLMKLEQKNHPIAQNIAINMYDKVEMPFLFYPGYNYDAMDYQSMQLFLIVLFSVIIATPIFSSDYQSGADDIIRCTKNGRTRFGVIKIISALIICVSTFALSSILYILTSNTLFGWECTKTSIQMFYSVVSLLPFNIGELQWYIVLVTLISLLATLSVILFISSKCKSNFASLSIGLLLFILPEIVSIANIPDKISNWLLCMLPSSGASLLCSYQYALTDFQFLNIGSLSIWTPYAMIGFSMIEILIFIGLTIYSYASHKIR